MVTKKKSNFRGKVSSDADRQRRAATTYGHLLLPRGVSVFSPELGGSVKLDFLPYKVTDEKHPDKNTELDIATPETLWYKRPYKIHRNVGADNETCVCLSSIGKKCPICEYRSKRTKEGADKEELKALRASERVLYVVVPLDSRRHEVKPHIFDIAQFLFQDLLNDELEEHEEFDIFPDIEEGLTLKVRFASNTIGSSKPFAEAARIDFLEREETYTDEILKDVPNLDEVLKVYSYDELSTKFFEEGEVDEDEEDEQISTQRTKRKELSRHSDKEDERPVRTKRSERTHHSLETHKCFYGFVFGVDTDKFDECDDCDNWNECKEVRDSRKRR